MDDLYNRILTLCEAKGVSVYKMSKDAGITRSLMTELKSGRTKKLSTSNLHKISQYFNVPIDFLLDLGEIDPSDIPPEPPVSKHQILFALFGDVADEITDAEYAEVQRYCDMVRLRKIEEKKEKR